MTQNAAEVGLLTFQQTVEFTESIALLSTAWTLLCAGLIEGRETILWMRNGFWEDYRLASITKVLEGEPAAKYLTTSVDSFETEPTILQAIGNWVLDIPVVFLLLFVAALLGVFYRWLAAVENGIATK